MSDKTLSVGSLVFTEEGTYFKYEEGKLEILVYPGWKKDVAIVNVKYPMCATMSSAGELPSVIESTLDSMRQELEQEVRRATKRLASFNAQYAEILGKINAQVDQPSTETP